MKKNILVVWALAACFSIRAEAGDFKIVKVSREPIGQSNFGKAQNDVGYQLLYIDKFYPPRKTLPTDIKGELYLVKWSSRGVAKSGETVQLVFEYTALNEADIRRKELSLSLDSQGLYETPIEHIGEEYIKEGRISAWRVSMTRNNQALSQVKSALWTQN